MVANGRILDQGRRLEASEKSAEQSSADLLLLVHATLTLMHVCLSCHVLACRMCDCLCLQGATCVLPCLVGCPIITSCLCIAGVWLQFWLCSCQTSPVPVSMQIIGDAKPEQCQPQVYVSWCAACKAGALVRFTIPHAPCSIQWVATSNPHRCIHVGTQGVSASWNDLVARSIPYASSQSLSLHRSYKCLGWCLHSFCLPAAKHTPTRIGLAIVTYITPGLHHKVSVFSDPDLGKS